MSEPTRSAASERLGLRPLALWGGIECTVNRVRDHYQDQLQSSGHHHRAHDLIPIAELGLKTLRYPILWERTAPERIDQPDWRWADERLGLLRQLQIRPIVGLVHHGCGPRYAPFTGPNFEQLLPRFARQVAERFPWVDAYTPVNEPLTTARFSGLYGHWFPHKTCVRAFAEILLRQCRATVLSMEQIRQVRPDARLIQTEDLGQVHTTPLLAYQAEWENHRRWLTWDLLCGRVTDDHPLWDYLGWVGISQKELAYFSEHPCPPSLIGVNHYITSERYLDEQLWQYPPALWGGNGRHQYVDTEAVRAAPEKRIGLQGLLQQTWDRYGLPIAVTEAHLGCTVDEQMRWLLDMWQQAEEARQGGADVRAVTAWALLGSYDWHCLMTRQEGCYEPGAFDVRSGQLHQTPLAELLQRLATHQTPDELVPPGPGWWQAVPNKKIVAL
ncbi:family 1 glycosylhydrolase [Larkinella ripae]